MLILINLLLLGIEFDNSRLTDVNAKWAVGVGAFGCDMLSVSWKPFKTFAIGMSGSVSCSNYGRETVPNDYNDYENESVSGSIGIDFCKYFVPKSPVSPFISISPFFNMQASCGKYTYPEEQEYNTTVYEDTAYAYGFAFMPGAEYFFKIKDKQLSLKFMTTLVSFLSSHQKHSYYRPYNVDKTKCYYSSYTDNWYFYPPTDMLLSTYICFHF